MTGQFRDGAVGVSLGDVTAKQPILTLGEQKRPKRKKPSGSSRYRVR